MPAANAYTGMTYTPLGQYYYSTLTDQIAAHQRWLRNGLRGRGCAAGGRRGIRRGAGVHRVK